MGFFSLPRELRDEIYSLLYRQVSPEDPPKLHIRGYATPEMPLPPSLALCKQFYNEALSYYIRSVQLDLPDIVSLSSIKQALIKSPTKIVLNNVQAVKFANIELFCIGSSASGEWMKWDRQKDKRKMIISHVTCRID